MSRSIFPAMLLLALWVCNVACDRQKKHSGLVHPEISPEMNQVIESKKNDHPAEAVVESVAEEPQVTDAVASDIQEDTFGSSTLFELAKADESMTAGENLLQTGEYAKALEQFKIAAEIDTENEEVFFNLGFAHARVGNTEEAIAAYQKTIEIFPDYGEAHNNLGNLFLKEKLFTRAIEHFKAGIEIDPEHAAAHNNLGTALSRQLKINEAVPHFVKATQIDDRYIQAWCNLGNAYTSQKRFKDALSAFLHVLRVDPSFPPALSGMQRLRSKVIALPR
ncbi:MAG: tetratricopeptide repeat protein [Verrucomicrobia bacterium]|jgi:tetratricopeptide (TPR) repeat protein|nr:tetratricopeptide repeat protein [Verrucomicrobiota bacterium]